MTDLLTAWTRAPTRRCLGAAAAPAARGRRAGAALAELVLAVEAAAPGSGGTCCSPTEPRSGRPPGPRAVACACRRRGPRRLEPIDDRAGGNRSPTGGWWWPALATAGSASSPQRRETHEPALLDIQLTDPDAEAALRTDAPRRLTAVPKHLRPSGSTTPRQRAVRTDHRAARVLPDADRTGTAGAHRGHLARCPWRTHRRARLRLVGQTGCCSTRFRRSARCADTWPQDVSEAALRQASTRWPPTTRTGPARVVGDLHRHLNRLPAAPAPHGRVPRVHHRQPAARERAEFLSQLRSVLRPGEQLLLGTAS